jgi:HEPN domain-containing protein
MLQRDDVAPRLGCFLAQQAAEKAIKARLIHQGTPFPRVHDLIALRGLLLRDAQFTLDDDELTELSAWAVEARYPSDMPEATASEARRAVDAARLVVVQAEEELDDGLSNDLLDRNVLTAYIDVARQVAADGQQRAADVHWAMDEHLVRVRDKLNEQCARLELPVRAWKWRPEARGKPLTPTGATTGLELRVSRYERLRNE